VIDGQDWGGHSRVNVKNAKALRVVLMGPATIALVVAQLAVATAFELSWLADDGRLGAWRTEH
jgi:hypothetical protein